MMQLTAISPAAIHFGAKSPTRKQIENALEQMLKQKGLHWPVNLIGSGKPNNPKEIYIPVPSAADQKLVLQKLGELGLTQNKTSGQYLFKGYPITVDIVTKQSP